MNNHKKKEYTITEKYANVIMLKLILPITIIVFWLYYYIWIDQFKIDYLQQILHGKNYIDFFIYSICSFIIIILGAILHELIHGITWVIFSKNVSFKSIKFGILKESYTPYCHCKIPLKRNIYIIGIIMPAVILGLFPVLIALIVGNIFLCFFGYIFLLAAIGDLIITYYLLKYTDSSSLIQDHDSKIGFYYI
ncbi:DUF3267 domain-containing protein [Sphingobacteriaceae bacterium WQ 2009]|uniref:DUF3267 domain-containing protein n=1 Tax=Rhinopithecimicrobium faecis TaxID=2820698 RepID=A0A8T4HEM9_9SPHI|nr:DUF3267 domain-containing protein [Sphingobacteriaceae bacterium WQ 2009]